MTFILGTITLSWLLISKP
jgi:MFS superfamily sulfate permease-like transporter